LKQQGLVDFRRIAGQSVQPLISVGIPAAVTKLTEGIKGTAPCPAAGAAGLSSNRDCGGATGKHIYLL